MESIGNGEDLEGKTIYDWANLYQRGNIRTLYNVPFREYGFDRCNLCDYNKDPCTYFNSDGTDPVAYKDCSGNLCSHFDRCKEIWDSVQSLGYEGTPYGGWDYTDYSGDLCSWAETTAYTFKTSIPTTISTLDTDCKVYMS